MICCFLQKHSVFAQFFWMQIIYIVNMYTQQRQLCRKQREGGQNYISWRTSEPLKRWSLVLFFFLGFFCWCWIMWLGPATEWKKTVSKTAEKSFWFALVSVVCRMSQRSCFVGNVWGTQDRQWHERWGQGKHPLRPACQTWATQFFRVTPLTQALHILEL